MNKTRREELRKLKHSIEAISQSLSGLVADEEDAVGAVPENLQGTDSYQNSEESLDLLYDAQASIYDAITAIDDVLSL